jgi:LemA protein
VLKYDNRLETIPSKFIAGMFNFMPREYFKAEEGATEVPRVQF